MTFRLQGQCHTKYSLSASFCACGPRCVEERKTGSELQMRYLENKICACVELLLNVLFRATVGCCEADADWSLPTCALAVTALLCAATSSSSPLQQGSEVGR
ncbi:hypothetical protein TRVL_09772 [Trypanosoma vivax]|nr:hypothetical protein TRVL_09772 [Trypanosoma vivax]